MKVPADLVEIQRNYLDAWKPPPKIIVCDAREAILVLTEASDNGDPVTMRRAMLAVSLWLSKLVDCELP